MTLFTGIILYAMIYWLVLFAVLPWGNRPLKQEDVEDGNVSSAPANPRIKQKFFITAFVAAAVWLVVYLLIYFDVIDFYQIAKQMRVEDME